MSPQFKPLRVSSFFRWGLKYGPHFRMVHNGYPSSGLTPHLDSREGNPQLRRTLKSCLKSTRAIENLIPCLHGPTYYKERAQDFSRYMQCEDKHK